MIKLFEIDEQGLPKLTAEARTLEPFKSLITKGKKPNIERSIKECAFVYWWAKFDSPYEQFNHNETEKTRQIVKAVDLESDWKPDDYVKEAIDFFLKIQRTKSMRYLESVEDAVNKLSNYLTQTDPNERIESGAHKGELVHDLNKYKTLAKEMPDLIESMQKAKDLVFKEMQEEVLNRAGRKTSKYNE